MKLSESLLSSPAGVFLCHCSVQLLGPCVVERQRFCDKSGFRLVQWASSKTSLITSLWPLDLSPNITSHSPFLTSNSASPTHLSGQIIREYLVWCFQNTFWWQFSLTTHNSVSLKSVARFAKYSLM